jgi:hypothetical protein
MLRFSDKRRGRNTLKVGHPESLDKMADRRLHGVL